MALDFSLDLATPATVDVVAAVVRDALVAAGVWEHGDAADLTGDGVRLRPGAAVRVGAVEPSPFPSILLDLGMAEPTAYVYVRLDKQADVAAQADLVVHTAVAVLRAVEGDAVLRFTSERVWLLRVGGTLVVSDDDAAWPSPRLALVPHPYDRRALALPE